MNDHQLFSERLRSAIDESGLSKQELARRIGVAPPAISRWLRQSFPEGRHVASLCNELNVSAPWLLAGGPQRSAGLLTGDGPDIYVPPASRLESSPLSVTVLREEPPAFATNHPEPAASLQPLAHANAMEARLRLMLNRVEEDMRAAATAPPAKRQELAQMARLHIDHFLAWLNATE